MAPTIRVLLFATARTAVGHPTIEWPVPLAGIPANELVRDLSAKFPALARVAAASRLVRNGRYVRRPSERVRPGDEFAIHPPYGGG